MPIDTDKLRDLFDASGIETPVRHADYELRDDRGNLVASSLDRGEVEFIVAAINALDPHGDENLLDELDSLRLIATAWQTLPEPIRRPALAEAVATDPRLQDAFDSLPARPMPDGSAERVLAAVDAKAKGSR